MSDHFESMFLLFVLNQRKHRTQARKLWVSTKVLYILGLDPSTFVGKADPSQIYGLSLLFCDD